MKRLSTNKKVLNSLKVAETTDDETWLDKKRAKASSKSLRDN